MNKLELLALKIYERYKNRYKDLCLDKITEIIYKMYCNQNMKMKIKTKTSYKKKRMKISNQQGIIIYSIDILNDITKIINSNEMIYKNIYNYHNNIDEIKYIYNDNYNSTTLSPKYDSLLSLIDESPDIELSICKFIELLYSYKSCFNKHLMKK
jgi:RNA processing factor Prp31